MLRIQQEGLAAYEEDGISGVRDFAVQDFKEKLYTVATVASIVYFPGRISQIRHLPLALRGGMSGGQIVKMYGGNLLPFPTIGGLGLGFMIKQLQSRGGRDAKQVLPPVAPGRRPRPLNPSRRVSPGKTSKPFWSNGKPKCKKGFRYDFKRKLCVRIK
ncbi:MAG: hypothetical protein [Circular genetic element sp.]|nr:MAG: hypothetical protein [Circular genetic element sp.]